MSESLSVVATFPLIVSSSETLLLLVELLLFVQREGLQDRTFACDSAVGRMSLLAGKRPSVSLMCCHKCCASQRENLLSSSSG
jgi:hypothetical protein